MYSNTSYLLKDCSARVENLDSVSSGTQLVLARRKLKEIKIQTKYKRKKVLEFQAEIRQFREVNILQLQRLRRLDYLEYRNRRDPNHFNAQRTIEKKVDQMIFEQFHCHYDEINKALSTINKNLDRFYELVENHEKQLQKESVESGFNLDEVDHYWDYQRDLHQGHVVEPGFKKFTVKRNGKYIAIWNIPDEELTEKQLKKKKDYSLFKEHIHSINQELERRSRQEQQRQIPSTLKSGIGKDFKLVRFFNTPNANKDWHTNFYEDKFYVANKAIRTNDSKTVDVERLSEHEFYELNSDNIILSQEEEFRRYGSSWIWLMPEVREWIIQMCRQKGTPLSEWM
jgi:hypothetical protein